MNKYAIKLIQSFESCRLEAYQDGGGVLTIGWGHTGNDVFPGLKITQQQADDLFIKDLSKFEDGISKLVKIPLSDQKTGALICLSYNIGLSALSNSTLLKMVNNGQTFLAANEFLKWDHDNGKVIKGLTNRRQAERKLFLSA